MHQPQYCEPQGGQYQLPWTYLHAIKDYVDMAWHLETISDAKAVVNFAPTLLEQIADYDAQLKARNKGIGKLKDKMLIALESPVQPQDVTERQQLISACLRANAEQLIDPYPDFAKLAEIAREAIAKPNRLHYINDQFIVDLLVWYHIAWMGESVHRTDERIQLLMKKGHHFNFHDRRELMTVMAALFDDLIPRYRRLAEQGKVELSVTPYAHPILPLMLDLESARQAMPDASMPQYSAYPDGEKRAKWHLEEGVRVFEDFFGMTPKGCWPSEGAISAETLELIEQCGFNWAATGENVLRHSLSAMGVTEQEIHQPYHYRDQTLACFFRDDGLSDLIGFSYPKWDANDAVADFIQHLMTIRTETASNPHRVVSIILDGENAWEYYAYNGYYFLQGLYTQLANHPDIDLVTFSDCLKQGVVAQRLEKMIAGSWVYGTFSTWIGDPDKNRAWDLLIEAKQVFDKVSAVEDWDQEVETALLRQLAICEGSDWFWWFGDYNAGDSVSDFERLFRLHLSKLYQMLGLDVPQVLTEVISYGGDGIEQAGTMRRGS